MNKACMTMVGWLASSLAVPACAGPDWDTVRAAEKRTAQPAAGHAPLDHGPRAQSTPWQNLERAQARHAATQARRDALLAAHGEAR